MHPAYSVIAFTTASGAGYGLLTLLAVFAALGLLPADRWFGFTAFGLAFALVVGGLLSSMFHLGHPERAWRALSQWRSSWLSREGLAAVATFVPTGVFAVVWVVFGRNGGAAAAIGLLGALCCVATVYCTAMIYASLKTIKAWCNGWTLPGYLAYAAMTGALLLNALVHLWGFDRRAAVGALALVSVAVAALVKDRYWRLIDAEPSVSTAETATGLGGLGKVTLLEAPHTEENYLMAEMGFKIARRHATKLRRFVLIVGAAVPFALTAAALAVGGGAAATALVLLAAIAGGAGVVVERWLLFAEAKHVVTLYYGAGTA